MTPPHCPTCRCLDEIRGMKQCVRSLQDDLVAPLRRECPICQGVWWVVKADFNGKSPCLCVETRDAQSS
jgi:hypothetical protein